MKSVSLVLLSALISTTSFASGSPLASKTVTCNYAITCSHCGKNDIIEEGSIPVANTYADAISFEKKLSTGATVKGFVTYSNTIDYKNPQTETGTILAQVSVTTSTGKLDQAEGHLFYDPASYDKMFATWYNGSRSESETLANLWSSLGYNVSCRISR